MNTSRENIHISARLKPSVTYDTIPIDIQSNRITITHLNTQKQFLFDQIFQTSSSQQFVYESIGFSLVETVVEGFHATILCYGQTAAGKTFTIFGQPENYGIIPRAAQHLLDIKNSENMKFILRVSCVQIYNDQVRDLLDNCQVKHIKESKEGVYIKDIVKELVKTYDDFREILNIVDSLRSTYATSMNVQSSRSHCILTFYLQIAQQISEKQIYKQGRLHCVDLAGSQRQKKTGSIGLRLKQANSINKNLVVLRNVIHALIESKQHIPYRDCKLTRILQDSFGGSTKTKLIANISTDLFNIQQTISTLRYSAIVSKITNCPKIHYDAKDLLIKQYIEEINRLKQQQIVFQPEAMQHSKLLKQNQQISQALKQQQDANIQLKNRIDALNKFINPSSQLPPLEKKKFNQYRKRKLEQLSQKQSILQKSKQLIKKADNQFQAQFSINKDNILEGQFENDNVDIEKLKQKYKLLKMKYINLKDQIKLIENDFEEERDLYESKIEKLQKDNIFYKDILQRFTSPEELLNIKSSTAQGSIKYPPSLFSYQKQKSLNKQSSYMQFEESIVQKDMINTIVNGSNKPSNDQNQQYFTLQRQQLCNTQMRNKRSKSKSLSKEKRFKPLKSPRHLKGRTQPITTFNQISPKPKAISSKLKINNC